MPSPFQTPRADNPEHSKQEQAIVRNGKGDLTDNLAESGLLHYLHFEDNDGFFPPSQLGKKPDTPGPRDHKEGERDTERYQGL